MKVSKSLRSNYNSKDAVMVISSYPPKGGESAKTNAVSNYTRELLSQMKKKVPVVVLCEIFDDKPEAYIENDILVVRCFHKNSLKLSWDILEIVKQFDLVETVMVQFEFNIFGKMLATGSTAGLFSIMKMMGKKTTFVFHQVLEDLSEMSGHLGLKGKNLYTSVLNQGIHGFYRIVGESADGIIVHDDFLKTRLSRFVSPYKIQVVPHGVTMLKKIVSKKDARNQLGMKQRDLILLAFGYISWYKGSDWIVRKVVSYAQKHPNRRVKLVLAGGESPTLNDRPHYQKFITDLKRDIEEHADLVTMTGYVPDAKKDLYFAASDIVILPYRAAMSASGPMSQAFAHGRPFLVSEPRFPSLTSTDIAMELKKAGIALSELTFFLRNGSFDRKLESLLSDKTKFSELANVSKKVGKLRSWSNMADKYLRVMHKGYNRIPKKMKRKPSIKLSELSVFFPLYNEEKNVVSLVRQAMVVLPNIADTFEILLINDGSKDHTKKLATELSEKYPEVRVINQLNKGYGGAVKRGLSEAAYEWVFFSDGDLQFDLEELQRFVPYTQLHDMVLGYRINRADGIKRDILALMLKIWNKIWLNFPASIKDIDCAFKLIHRDVLFKVQDLDSDGAMMTTELLLKAYKAGFSFTQLGVTHYPRLAGKSTGSNYKVVMKAVRETFKLRELMRDRKSDKRLFRWNFFPRFSKLYA